MGTGVHRSSLARSSGGADLAPFEPSTHSPQPRRLTQRCVRLRALDGCHHVGVQLDAAELRQQLVQGALRWRGTPFACSACAGGWVLPCDICGASIVQCMPAHRASRDTRLRCGAPPPSASWATGAGRRGRLPPQLPARRPHARPGPAPTRCGRPRWRLHGRVGDDVSESDAALGAPAAELHPK